jgi:hypothetical protein
MHKAYSSLPNWQADHPAFLHQAPVLSILTNLRAKKQAKLDQAARIAATGSTEPLIFNLLNDANTIHHIIHELENPESALFAGLY